MVAVSNKRSLVLNHLVKHKNITRACALQQFGVQNLADVIYQLRGLHGIFINMQKIKLADGMKIAVYSLPKAERSWAKEVLTAL